MSLQDLYGLLPAMVVHGVKMVYVPMMQDTGSVSVKRVFKMAGILVVACHSRIDICELQVSCGLTIMIHKIYMHYALH